MCMTVASVRRGAGSFVATDTRIQWYDGLHYDIGGKLGFTGSGWVTGVGEHHALGVAMKALRKAGPSAPADGDPIRRAVANVYAALREESYEVPDRIPEGNERIFICLLLIEATAPNDVTITNGNRYESISDSWTASLPRELSDENASRREMMLLDFRCAGYSLPSRIRAAAKHFAAIAARAKSVSSVMEVGYIEPTNVAQRLGFLRGEAREIAEADPIELLDRFRAVCNNRIPDEIFLPTDDGDYSVRGENGDILHQEVLQRNGTNAKNIASGRYTVGTVVNAQSITYPTNYQNPPAINILGGISYEPASVWGTPAQADANTGAGGLAPIASRQIDEVVAYNVTAATASLRARLRQASATTARSDTYASGAITTNGDTKEATTANAPAANDTYTTDFAVQFTSSAVPGKACSVSGNVCLDYWNGSTWTQVASATYSANDPVGGAADTGLISDTLVATVSGLTSSSKFRIRLVTGAGAGTRTYSVDPGNCTYITATGDQYASKTPTIGGVDLGIKLSVEVIGAS
jgi:hypothetical protein